MCLNDDAIYNLLLRYVQTNFSLHTGGLHRYELCAWMMMQSTICCCDMCRQISACILADCTAMSCVPECWCNLQFVAAICADEFQLAYWRIAPLWAVCLNDHAIYNLLLRYVQTNFSLHTGGLHRYELCARWSPFLTIPNSIFFVQKVDRKVGRPQVGIWEDWGSFVLTWFFYCRRFFEDSYVLTKWFLSFLSKSHSRLSFFL